eukprot:TRINITY_DN70688_c0_g1_i1.p1 TRINITY_DN70688_c0_g1~~TRINITY_DN70688_c0_g1_i1.p1  ORF type:complete len:207 (-),score=34.67 TRINITY_DN70688_c0_g1_i1:141-698(-)
MFAVHFMPTCNSLLLADWNGAAVHALSLEFGATVQVVQDEALRGVSSFTEDDTGVIAVTSNGMVRLHFTSLEPPSAQAATHRDEVGKQVVLEDREMRPCSIVCNNGFLQIYESSAMRNEFACEEFELKHACCTEHGAEIANLASMDTRICYRHWSTMVNPELTLVQVEDRQTVIIRTTMGLYQVL